MPQLRRFAASAERSAGRSKPDRPARRDAEIQLFLSDWIRSRWPKINLPAAQIFERANIGLRQDVHLLNRETKNVVNSVLQVRRFALGPKVFEHIGLRDGEIDAPQIQQIV